MSRAWSARPSGLQPWARSSRSWATEPRDCGWRCCWAAACRSSRPHSAGARWNAVSSTGRALPFRRGREFRLPGEMRDHAGALANRAVDPEMTLVQLDQGFHQWQAEAGALLVARKVRADLA